MPPLNLLMKPASGLCNMRCRYCFYADVQKNRSISSYGLMDLKTLEVLVEKALAYADDTCTFGFQGGEPTLVGLSFYEKLVEYQTRYNYKKVKIQNAIQTNGLAITEEWAIFFAKHHFLVGLSLDGTARTHDFMRLDTEGNPTFTRIMKTVRLLTAYQVDFNILCVVNRYNAKHAAAEYRFFRANQLRYLQFIPCLDGFHESKTSYSLLPGHYAHFLKTTFDLYYQDFFAGHPINIRLFDNFLSIMLGMSPESCDMNGTCYCYLVIEADGSVYPCDFYVLDAWNLGNIHEHSLSELQNSSLAKKFVQTSQFVDEKCRNCQWYFLCRGGCRRLREPFLDNHPQRFLYCDSYQEFFPYAYPRMHKMAQVILSKA